MGLNHPKLILRKNQNDYSNLAFVLKKFLNVNLYHFKNLEKSKCTNCKSTRKKFYLSKCIPDFNIVKNYGIFCILGVISGAIFAATINAKKLILFFSIVTFLLGIYLLIPLE